MGSVEFDVVCDKCRTPLDASFEMDRRNELVLRVEPCEKCMEKAKEDGDAEGYDRGKADAEEK